MARVTIEEQNKTLTESGEIASFLTAFGIDFERWQSTHSVAPNSPDEEILNAYQVEIESLKTRGGYVTADVIDITADTPGLEEMLAKFNREHWHDEDEVRFVISGHGVFHVHPQGGPVLAIEVEAGDLLRVPRGTRHWFNLCADRSIRAIRLFQDTAGWTPHYTASGVDEKFVPVCFSVSHPQSLSQGKTQ